MASMFVRATSLRMRLSTLLRLGISLCAAVAATGCRHTFEVRHAPASATGSEAASDPLPLDTGDDEAEDTGADVAVSDAERVRTAEEAELPEGVLGHPVGIDHWQAPVSSAFFAALQRAERGEGQARLVFYGASHVAADLFTGHLRRAMQTRFGEAGAGFVLPAKPWRFYRHQLISFERDGPWQALRVRARRPLPERYGFAGVALETDGRAPARASIETKSANSLSGHVSRYRLFFAKQPAGGRFDVWIDGAPVRRIDTAATEWDTGYATFDVDDGHHRFEIRTRTGGPVRVYGVALEREGPGVILDTVGINGARATDQLLWDDALYREHLAQRQPDLVVLAFGTNEAGDDMPLARYEAGLREVIGRVQEVAPKASCLLIGPSDRPLRVEDDAYVDRPRTAELVTLQGRVAGEMGCGFFDLVAFMGGPLSMAHWAAADPPYGAPDHVHFTVRGYYRLGEVLYDALLEGYAPEEPLAP